MAEEIREYNVASGEGESSAADKKRIRTSPSVHLNHIEIGTFFNSILAIIIIVSISIVPNLRIHVKQLCMSALLLSPCLGD